MIKDVHVNKLQVGLSGDGIPCRDGEFDREQRYLEERCSLEIALMRFWR